MKNRRGFTLVEITIAVAIIALLAVIAMPNLLNARKNANEASTQSTLRIISNALETYASDNNGQYAAADGTTSDNYLTGATPPYLNKSYCGTTNLSGYDYSCVINMDNYSVTASATNCGTSGSKDYTITNGSILSSAGCS